MLCSQCQAENKPNAKFCTECGSPMISAPARESAPVDEFELAPEIEKAPKRAEPQGPARIDLDAEPTEEKDVPAKKEKKEKKPLPERPRDYGRESKMMLLIGGGIFVVLCFVGGYIGLGGFVAAVFGALAMLESMKVDEYYKAGDYEGAETASLMARRYLKIGVIAGVVALVLTISIAVVMAVFSKISNVITPKSDI